MPGKNRKSRSFLSHKVDCRIPENKYLELQKLLSQGQGLTMSELVRNILMNRKIRVVHYDSGLDLILEKLSDQSAVIQSISIQINQLIKTFFQTEELSDKKAIIRKTENFLAQVISNQAKLERDWGKLLLTWLQK